MLRILKPVAGALALSALLSGPALAQGSQFINVLTGGTSANGDVAWQCGSKPMASAIAAGTTAFEGAGGGGTAPQKSRPAECRG